MIAMIAMIAMIGSASFRAHQFRNSSETGFRVQGLGFRVSGLALGSLALGSLGDTRTRSRAKSTTEACISLYVKKIRD